MRTNIEIDDRLMRQAMKISGARTKKATVEAALKLLAAHTPKVPSADFEGRSGGKAILRNPARADFWNKDY